MDSMKNVIRENSQIPPKVEQKLYETQSSDSGFDSDQNSASDGSTIQLKSESGEGGQFNCQKHNDSGMIGTDSSQKICPTVRERVYSDYCHLCESFLQLQLKSNRVVPPLKWEKYFHQDDDGDTYLHVAIVQESSDMVEKLIGSVPASWLDIQNAFGHTPLHLAMLTGQRKIVRRLLEAGSRSELRDAEGNTALHLACLKNRIDCVKEFLEFLSGGASREKSVAVRKGELIQNLEARNYDGKRCVHIAAELSNVDILLCLVKAGADINSREAKSGYTALHIAIEAGNEQFVNLLLNECPNLWLEQVTYAGLTAYQLAAILHNQRLLNGLKNRGAEPLTPPDSDYDEEDSEDDEQIIDGHRNGV
ncbi:NF-kappa-B inhibitor cactus-like [Toxorhynchites rutilus septentrionalis]|uniref:NF-kappa-B inhibitor cactus-like n=1 Tax=Toxorhynchites rutilus septentrionalis TaxID=329112 RepID=UPI00247ACE2C|nr:NF-kappa-B inhibitor cactus-like [Toxorhynchites rutilus septentrionalis]XP_055639475.1 NF-kappa-B inhibitor cactus-like [Toxorhynchites rutilus septentrionalis]